MVVLKHEFLNERAFEREMDGLHAILQHAESDEQFCIAHELVDRNRITRKHKRILKAIRFTELPAFCFFINRN